ncbi:hypothetical protein [Mesorhizobium sp. WSM1497]|uniref:hypothetical protein n=1 Tax=Mesorhizobium sp. WSM1497 TaxID=278153 RepID=UPI001FD955EB|nr:hypothetical protein [Mesorhizobium sp. WSM1497]
MAFLATYSRSLLGERTILCGDYNVVPTDIDAVVPGRWLGDAVFFPESRKAYARMLSLGWVDAIRRIHPGKGIYTYWNFHLSRRQRPKLRPAYGSSACNPIALRGDYSPLRSTWAGRQRSLIPSGNNQIALQFGLPGKHDQWMEHAMRFPHGTTAAAVTFIALTFPALAQTSETPAPSTPAPPPATEQPRARQLPDADGHGDGPTREMIRQMVEQAVRERMQQDRGSDEGYRDEEGSYDDQGSRDEDADHHDEASRHGDRWRNYGDWGRGHRMTGHRGHQMMRHAGMRLMFGLLDTDGDGSLSKGEVQGAVARMFSSIDENGDGKIDRDEIQSFMHGSNMHGTNSEDMP